MTTAGASKVRSAKTGTYLVLGLVAVLVTLLGSVSPGAGASPALTGVDLSRYVRVGRFDLPEPTRTPAPPNSLLAQEASSVTYDWDTNTLFVVGDGGTSVVQVTKTGQLIDSMTLAPGSSPQGTEFYDTEAITYVGGGKFVLGEERYRQVNLFTYVPGGVLQRADVQTVKLGTTIGNIGIEGISYDPQTSTPTSPGFIVVKEQDPEGIFQTNIDFPDGTATVGSPTTDNPPNLFDPSLAGTADFSDVFSLSNLPNLTGPDASHLLIISQESGKIVNVDRAGVVSSSLTITDPGSPISVPDETHEGVTMDPDGFLYTVCEDGGGDVNHPQLWVYAPSTAANQAPTGLTLANQVTTLPENTSTASRVKVADVSVADDGLGTNNLSVSGPDAASFEVDSTGLYLKAGTVLSYATKNTYNVTVAVDDPTVGTTPDATASYTLHLTQVGGGGTGSVIISEVAPWGSGSTPYGQDWFEVTNTGASDVDLTGWKMDDNSNSFANAVPLHGVTTLPAGKSAVFVEDTGGNDTTIAAGFAQAWFGGTFPHGFLIGEYGGSGVGLSQSGDAVNLFDSAGNRVTGVSFGASPSTFTTFDNTVGAGSTTLPLPAISTLSVEGVNGAFASSAGTTEIGSPGTTAPHAIISEVAPWGSGNTPYAADWFEVTNTGSLPLDLTGWKMDDSSDSFGSAVPMHGLTAIPAGKSAVFFEDTSGTDATIEAAFLTAWLGTATPPPGFLAGFYGGSGVGLSTGGDAVNLFDSAGHPITGVTFGTSPSAAPFASFDNTAGAPAVATLSAIGVDGAIRSFDGNEIGSPVPVTDTTPPTVTATPSPQPNANGWNNTAVTVSYACTDTGLGVDPAASSLADDVLSASGTATGTCVDRAGNSASASYTAQIDEDAPTVTYAGNAGTYGLLDTVAITCTAADALSGVASSTCANASGPAWAFGAGSHTLSAQATDRAGNTGSASTTFAVTVKPANLCTLTTQFVQSSAKYQTLKPLPRLLVDVLVNVACNVVLDFTPTARPAQKAQLITLYKQAVQALVQPGWLTTGQASTLNGLASAL